jgi:hypothetical protein
VYSDTDFADKFDIELRLAKTNPANVEANKLHHGLVDSLWTLARHGAALHVASSRS